MWHTGIDGAAQRLAPALDCLSRNAIYEIQVQVRQPDVAGGVDGINDVCRVMQAFENAQVIFEKRLRAKRDTVDAAFGERFEFEFGCAGRIGFDGPLVGTPSGPSDSFEQPV